MRSAERRLRTSRVTGRQASTLASTLLVERADPRERHVESEIETAYRIQTLPLSTDANDITITLGVVIGPRMAPITVLAQRRLAQSQHQHVQSSRGLLLKSVCRRELAYLIGPIHTREGLRKANPGTREPRATSTDPA